jgi:ABC-2 type transport system ATP-binding protein
MKPDMQAGEPGLAIYCEDLTRHYGEIKAVEGLTLKVNAGSVFGFLGRNGAGKTTTIRMLTGLAQPTRGRAWVAGIEITSADSQARRKFGYLPQSPAFYNWMTPREYLQLSAQLFEIPTEEAKKRIAEVLELVNLTKAAKRKIGGFSGGMFQRLGIAQALVHDPPVLLLDEPTSALDPAGRYEVLDLIAQLRGKVTVFLSSHILADIERVCDSIAILREGQLVLVSERAELLSNYATSTVLLALDNGQQFPQIFIEALRTQPWVDSRLEAQPGTNELRVPVIDINAARKKLLPFVVEHHLELVRYEWVRPTLEEIFLKLSA